MKKLLFIAGICYALLACTEEDNDLSGRYNFIEPPHPISRLNRLDYSQVAFDVIFSVDGTNLTEVDLVLAGEAVDGATGSISPSLGNQIIFEGGGGRIELHDVHRLGHTLQVTETVFILNGKTTTYGPLQIDRYPEYSNGGNGVDCVRIGAICNDGTTSEATSSGACSSHGGVKRWICD